MFERLNRIGELMLLSSLSVIPLCHFLDKEGYRFTWNWFSKKFGYVCYIIMIIELIEIKYSSPESIKSRESARNEDSIRNDLKDTESGENIQTKHKFSEFSIHLLIKIYNLVLLYLTSDLLDKMVNSDLRSLNFIFDRLFIIFIMVFILKTSVLHYKLTQQYQDFAFSMSFAFFCFNCGTNLFLMLLTLSDSHKENLMGFLSNLRYRDIEDVAFFIECLNLLVVMRVFLFARRINNNFLMLLSVFLFLKIFVFNQIVWVNSLCFVLIPVINGVILFGNFDHLKKNQKEFSKSIFKRLFYSKEKKILEI